MVLFEEYVAARGRALLRFAYVLTADSYAAEDLVQSALADAYRHWRKVSKADHPDAYVRRIIVNTTWGGAGAAGPANGPPAWIPTQRLEQRVPVQPVLLAVEVPARTILVLRYYADLDDAAIADLLQLSPSTVRSTASRALATLRQDHSHLTHADTAEEH